MPKPRPAKEPAPPSKQPSVDDRNRRAFLDELEGRVSIAAGEEELQRRVDVATADTDGPPPAKTKKPLAESLAAVLPARSGKEATDLTTFDRAKRSSRWWIPVVILVVLAAVTVAGFLFFSRSSQFSGNNVGISFDGPTSVASGDTIELTIRYHNDETVDIREAALAVTFPEGFTVGETEPDATDDFRSAFSLGTIRSGAVGEVVIQGQVVGSVGTKLSFTSTLSYRPANYNSEFQATANTTITVASSSVQFSITGPASIAPGVEGTWTVHYQNTSDDDIAGLQVEGNWPALLTVKKTNPNPTSQPATWRLGTLAAGSKGTIAVTGTLSGEAGDSAEFAAVLNIIRPGNVTERQAEATYLTAVAESGLSINVAANGATNSSNIKPGEVVSYSIQLENNHDTEVSDVTVTATFSGTIFDLDKRQDPAAGTIKGKVLTWTKKQIPALELMKAGQKVNLTLTIPTLAPVPAKIDSERNPQGALSLAVSSPDIPATAVKPVVLVTKVQTTMTFSADARYYDDQGQALGSGPVPPKVGQTTSYRIQWAVISTTNDIQGFTATTVLPTQVLWTGKNVGRDAGDITFDPATRTVTWKINTVAGGTGSRYATLRANFEVSITPTADQVGSVVILTESTTATGTDSSTQQPLSSTAESLTTDVPNDPTAAGEGKVLP